MKNVIFGFHSINTYLTKNADNIEIIYIDSDRQDKRMQELLNTAKQHQIQINTTNDNELSKLSGNKQHQGVVAKIKQLSNQQYSLDWLISQVQNNSSAVVLVLDGITDPHNLGAIIRTADCFGVVGIILPQNNSANTNNAIVVKSSVGATQNLPIIMVNNLSRAIDTLKKHDFWIFGTSLTDQSIPLTEVKHKGKMAWVMGSEGSGLRRLVAENCDYLVTIPMYGKTQSLNVSVATGVILAYNKFMQL